jgi:hypothetical protein
MKMKKQGKETTGEATGESKGKIPERTHAVEKPSRAGKPMAKKTIAEKTRVTEKSAVTEKPRAAASAAPPEKPKAEPRGIKKKYIESRNICEVTFTLPGEASLKARTVSVVGDFNGWKKEATFLKKQENGDFTATLQLDPGKEYRFRYLIDGQRWENDWHADKYVRSPYGVEDSVVCVMGLTD